MLTPRTWE